MAYELTTLTDLAAVQAQLGIVNPTLRRQALIGRIPLAMASPPTIADNATTQIASPGTSLDWNSSLIKFLGGKWVQVGVNPRAKVVSVARDGTDANASGLSGGQMFYSDASKIEVQQLYNMFRVYVDELDGKGWQIAGTVTSGDAGASPHFTLVDWTSASTPRKPRLYKILADGSQQFYAIKCSIDGSIWAYRSTAPTVVVIGDSFSEGGAANYIDGYVPQLAFTLGVDDVIPSGSGGTGLLKTNGSNVNYLDRVDWTLNNIPADIYVIQGTQNDGTFTPSQLSAQLALVDARIKALRPSSRRLILGVWNCRLGAIADGGGTYQASNNAAMAAYAAAQGIPFVDWSDWITGSGNTSSQNGTGTADYYTVSDNTHPSVAGAIYRAQRLAPLIAAATPLL